MFENTGFGKTMDLLERGMGVESLRRQAIANNIANVDVPNFKRTTVNFESELKRALDSETKRVVPEAILTDERHIPFDRPIDYRTVKPRRVLDYLTTSKNNGNNVDIDEEMMQSMNNQLRYQLMTYAIAGQFNTISMVTRA